MHQLASGHDSQFSCPVGIIGFGLGATDQPRTDATAGTDALAGAAAGPATAMAATSTGTIAATRLNFPARPAFCAARTAEAAALSTLSWSLQCLNRQLTGTPVLVEQTLTASLGKLQRRRSSAIQGGWSSTIRSAAWFISLIVRRSRYQRNLVWR